MEQGWQVSKPVEVIEVIRTELDLRGHGTPDEPYRRVTQYWTKDGELLFERDPCEDPIDRLVKSKESK